MEAQQLQLSCVAAVKPGLQSPFDQAALVYVATGGDLFLAQLQALDGYDTCNSTSGRINVSQRHLRAVRALHMPRACIASTACRQRPLQEESLAIHPAGHVHTELLPVGAEKVVHDFDKARHQRQL